MQTGAFGEFSTYACYVRYDQAVVKDRYVSFDGSTEVLHQHFDYSTTWGSDPTSGFATKQTTVTTTDNVANQTTITKYNYLGLRADHGPYDAGGRIPSQVPVESSIVYQNGSGSILKTINKTWANFRQLIGDQTILDNGQGATTLRCYNSDEQVTATYEYDFQQNGPKPSDPSCVSSSGLNQSAIGPLLRETATIYQPFFQGFSNGQISGTHIVVAPQTLTVLDGAGATAKQTNFFYDQNALQPSGAINLASPPGSAKGNITKIQRLVSGTNTFVTTTYSFFDTGQLYTMTDGCGNLSCSDVVGSNHTTTYSYADSSSSCGGTAAPGGQSNAYLTLVTNPLGQKKSYCYSYSDGQPRSATDENGQVTNFYYGTTPSGCSTADTLDRPTEVDHPDGGQTTYCYNDATFNTSANTPSVTQTTLIATGVSKSTTTALDGMGHTVRTLDSDPEGLDITDIAYDGIGDVYTHSNPHRSSASTTDGTTIYAYDAIGRVTQVTEPDGSLVATSYSGNRTTVSDELGNKRTTQIDGLGRLTDVWEAPNVSGYNFNSHYRYSALNDLLCAVQKATDTTAFTSCSTSPASWRPRSFVYDSLSRLTSATNPESGTISYSYDADGNLATRTAPSPNQAPSGNAVVTNYTYDALNRLISKGYTDSYAANPATMPAVYGYDGKAISGCPSQPPPGDADTYPLGRRTAMCDGSGATNWTHDKMGRTLQERRTIGSIAGKNGTDVYNVDGSVASMTSLGFQVTYTYSAAGRALSALGGNAFVQSNSATYAPFGGLTGARMGPTPIVISNTYNNRLQPLLISASAASNIISLCYDFHMVVVPNPNTACSLAAGSGDNGNVFQIVNNRDNNRTQKFLYDPLNRISQAYTSGSNWGETYSSTATNPGVQPTSPGIDPWGNLTNRSGVTGKTQTEGFSAAPATVQNRLPGFGYDPAGNMISNGTATYVYDAENRLIAVGGVSYIYDGNGRRVKKCTAGTIAGTCATSAVGTLYWSVPDNGTLTETDLTGNTLQNYVFFNGARIARRDASGAVHFYFSDNLGTHSLITDLQGDMPPQEESDYYPYGGEIPVSGSDSNHYKFTGKERDAESGLDNFGARYDGSSLGRFMTPDPSPNDIALGDPQSWNLYSYVRNRPTRSVDVGGHWATDVHAEIVTVALQGLVSAGELKQLIAEQYVMDKNQDPQYQYRHAMSNGQSNPPQSSQEASSKMWDFVAAMMGGASATLGPNGQFNSVSLAYLGDAIHTVEDYTSPMHTSQSGEPLPWYGASHGGFQHWLGENSPSDSWAGFGRAVRLTMAAFMQANPEQAKKNGLTEATFNAEADRRISQYVQNYFRMSGNVMSSDHAKEDMTRACALGNPAACD
jgi:RHS repeat-associated protein